MVTKQTGVLYLCATPIGNLEDITLRVRRVLEEVSLIAAEDTRRTRKLLSFYNIHTPMVSYREQNKREQGQRLITELKKGTDIALVSDAGTPGISDPGQDLVRLAIREKIKIVPLPGASAVITALISSGLPTDRFVFEGFLPRTKKERNRRLAQVAAEERTLIFYESPKRVLKTLEEIMNLAGNRNAAVARELTKIHEQIIRGRISELLEYFQNNPPKGEFTVVLEGNREQRGKPAAGNPLDIYETVNSFMRQGGDKKKAIKQTAHTLGISKREVYNAVLKAEGRELPP